MPRAVSDAMEVPARLVHRQWPPRLACTSLLDGATHPASDWPHNWAPASLVCACSAPPHGSAAPVMQRFPSSEPAAADARIWELGLLAISTPAYVRDLAAQA